MRDRSIFAWTRVSAALSVCALLVACADDAAGGADGPELLRAEAEAAPGAITPEGMFPPPKPGYTRLHAAVMKGLKPGTDTMRCQYVQAPLDHDVDILGVEGYQSEGGHHAVAYASTVNAPLHVDRNCGMEDNASQGAFLGGVGGEAGGGTSLPPGVAFRLKAGSSILLNVHFLNVSDEIYDGYSVVDFKFAEVSAARPVASMFTNGSFSFKIAPMSAAESVAECKVSKEFSFVTYSNHMHDYGTSVKSEIVRANGSVELIHEDPVWSYEMQFTGGGKTYGLDAPLKLHPGDKLRTTCKWKNPTVSLLTFPREMCIGVGFFLSDGSSSPVCFNGTFIDMAPRAAPH